MWQNAVLVVASLLFSLFAFEASSRLLIPVGDFLNPLLVVHPQFKTMIYPNSAGHDKWGFRNAFIPEQPDAVAVGDSFTYGYLAAQVNAWPNVLARETGLTVYNLSMGGWGPAQYLCATKVYAHVLRPRIIIIGLYLGNDILQAALEEYPCKVLDVDRIKAGYDVVVDKGDTRYLDTIRTWLSQHSVAYQLAKNTLQGTPLLSKWAILGERTEDYFDVKGSLVRRRYEQNAVVFTKGIAATINYMHEIRKECRVLTASCYVVIIPTKESIYYTLYGDAMSKDIAHNLREARADDEKATDALLTEFAQTDLQVVDALHDLLEEAQRGTRLYAPTADPHFGLNGYRVLGSLVARKIIGERKTGNQ
jgi:hypothetical protein